MLGLVGVLPARTAFAHDAPAIAPARLEFDASQAPKLCNDRATFRTLLDNWVAVNVWSPDADRRLVVRIRRAPTGEKLGEVALVDAAGATIAEHHERYGAREECYKVLYESASAAAKLLGAF
ncbi:MAG: hypothetical protein IPM54_37090 [Polyangiaceae bacterium]|nr:hypothetical protein [Polyangiaceae bacterium]